MDQINSLNQSCVEDDSPENVLKALANDLGCDIHSQEFPELMDLKDPLRKFRDEFSFPVCPIKGKEVREAVYLCGHSLGLKPKRIDENVQRVLHDWRDLGVNAHHEGFLPAALCETYVQKDMADLVGAKPSEVAILNGLTVNLHLMLTAFYKPSEKRFKILIEDNAFSSDMYAVKSQISAQGLAHETALVTFKPREGEICLRHEDMLDTISKEGPQLALVILTDVQFLTGQKHNMAPLVKACRDQGCVVGVQLAHSVGNVPVHLDDWSPDFAVWCTYKYMCAGPGSLAALYVHERHFNSSQEGPNYLQGWFGNKFSTRFDMDPDFDPDEGAARFKLSNTSPVMVAMLKTCLEIFKEAGTTRLCKKQFLLTGYLEYLLNSEIKHLDSGMVIVTPKNPKERGCQLSLQFGRDIDSVAQALEDRGVIVDVRKKRAVRVGPNPLYNSFKDVRAFVTILKEALDAIKSN